VKIDETHDPRLQSWIESANVPGCPFPIQNLPFGIFRRNRRADAPRGGVAIGEEILDLAAVGLKTGTTLNGLAAAGRPTWRRLRKQLSRALSDVRQRKRLGRYLIPQKEAELLLPLAIGDYSDFYAGIHHATNIGRLLRPENPLLPNYKWIPIGYHGRSSSIVISGTSIVRPIGQLKPPDAAPRFAPSARLDYEAELGIVVGPGNKLGARVPVERALDHVFGVVLLNDWSARDIQAWEYQPLGPFLAKSFATTISPWIVTLEALAPYRCPAFARAADDPKPLPYLWSTADQEHGGFAIDLEMQLRTPAMRAPERASIANFRDSYWTVAQMIAHHTSNGCNLRPGDLLGSGTISGVEPHTVGSLMELTKGGKEPLRLATGETRAFLEDGDEVVQRGHCARNGYASIGLGEATGRIVPAHAR